jgi:hypothetical protein
MYFSTAESDARTHGMSVYVAALDVNPLIITDSLSPEMDRIRRAAQIDDEYLDEPDEGLWHLIVSLANSSIEVGAWSAKKFNDLIRKMGYNAIFIPNAIVRQSRGNPDARGDYLVVFDPASIIEWREAGGGVRGTDELGGATLGDVLAPVAATVVLGALGYGLWRRR